MHNETRRTNKRTRISSNGPMISSRKNRSNVASKNRTGSSKSNNAFSARNRVGPRNGRSPHGPSNNRNGTGRTSKGSSKSNNAFSARNKVGPRNGRSRNALSNLRGRIDGNETRIGNSAYNDQIRISDKHGSRNKGSSSLSRSSSSV